ncbi:holin [Paenarthrobacter sp. YJN-5]|uniref:holin n=1 Tax=Paenarthrobacter sp. YJN-5 TaxID=2735316 RepID=UPI00187761E7|nr:holin [Paenarthrobacter sp. YJN-5]QOT15872.1 Holin [Paenarthrobacter sp. YJN-5]
MLSAQFWLAAGERAVKTFAQVLLGFMTTGAIGITNLPWNEMLSVAATAALASVLTSIVSGARDGNPSATNAETTPAYEGKHEAE